MYQSIKQNGAIRTQITIDEHQSYWRRAREKTQSSMSGLYFGFYKTTAKIRELANLSTQMINIPFRTGYSSWRAKGYLKVTLQKKPNCYDPKKQRTIHLLEADFQKDASLFSAKE